MGSAGSARNIVTISHLDLDLEVWCKAEAESRSLSGQKVPFSTIVNEMVREGMETYLKRTDS